MAISLKLDSNGNFLHCQGSGQFSLKDACSMYHDIFSASAERSASEVLVDCLQIGGNPTTVDRYEFAEFIAGEVVGCISEEALEWLGVGQKLNPER